MGFKWVLNGFKLCIAVVFITNLGFSAEDKKGTKEADIFYIDPGVAKIVAKYQGLPKNPHIFIIQDLHCHEAAQYKIYDIIKILKDRYKDKFKLVGIEGSVGVIDTSIVKNIPNEELKVQLSKQLMERGLMTGAEYYDVCNPGQILLYGVEDVDLYNKNLEQLKKGLFDNKALQKEIKKLEYKNIESKHIFYGKKLRKIEGLEKEYSKDKIATFDFIEHISEIVGADYAKTEKNYPNLTMYLNNSRAHKNINFSGLKMEATSIINSLSGELSEEEQKLIKTESKDNDSFYDFIIDFLDSKNIAIDTSYKNFTLYRNMVQTRDRIDEVMLLNELNEYVEHIKRLGAETLQEQKVLYIVTYSDILADYITNNISLNNRRKFDVEADRFFDAVQARYGLIDSDLIKEELVTMRDFYDTALKRNEVLVKNLLDKTSKYSALIVGGFHTAGVRALLRGSGCGYVVFLPMVEGEYDKSKEIYLDRMKNETGINVE